MRAELRAIHEAALIGVSSLAELQAALDRGTLRASHADQLRKLQLLAQTDAAQIGTAATAGRLLELAASTHRGVWARRCAARRCAWRRSASM